MTKSLPLMFLLLSGVCFAQTVCTNNVDSNGSVCTNFTTLPHGYVQSSTIPPFLIDTEDGQASSGGNAVNFTQPYNMVNLTLPFDPLKIEGLVPSYGTNETSMFGYRQSDVILSGTPGKTDYVEQWTLGGLTDDAYTWSGTFTVTYTIQNWVSCGGRAHRSCAIYGTGQRRDAAVRS